MEEPRSETELGPGIEIPDHRIIRPIGKGSYGEVWLARSTTGRYRAVKVVRRSAFSSDKPFERELAGLTAIEPISRLHEGLVDVLHVGRNEEGGCFYYVMELADDLRTGNDIDPDNYIPKTLAVISEKDQTLPVEECARIGSALTAALGHLHENDLVHRDIKPSNVIFIDGRAKLADVGLVANLAHAHSFVGTTGYIPPEGPGTPQADIYSLGKVLYEISMGKDRCEFPALPTFLGELTDGTQLMELNEIVLKACKNDPHDRYSTAEQMQSDLLVLLNGESVRRLRLLEERFKSIKRAATVGLIGLLLTSAIAYPIYREWTVQRDAHQRQIGSHTSQALSDMKEGRLIEAFSESVNSLQLEPQDQSTRLRITGLLDQMPQLEHLWQFDQRLEDVAFSPDGTMLAISVYTQSKGGIYVHDLRSGERIQTLEQPYPKMVSFSHSGRLLAAADQNHYVLIWDLATSEQILELDHSNKMYSVLFTPDDRHFFTAGIDGIIRKWNLEDGSLAGTFEGHTATVAHLALNSDGTQLASAGRDNTARIWEVATFTQTQVLPHPTWVTWVDFSPDGTQLATGVQGSGTPCEATIWRLDRGEVVRPGLLHDDGVSSVEYSPDGQTIATASLDGTVRLWDAFTHRPLEKNSILEHRQRVMRAAFSPDGRHLATVSVEGTARLWNLSASVTEGRSYLGAMSANGKWSATVEAEAFAIASVDEPDIPVHAILLEGGPYEIICGNTGEQVLWKPRDGAWKLSGVDGDTTALNSLTNSPSDNRLQFDSQDRWAAYRQGNTVHLLDTLSKELVQLDHGAEVATLLFAPGGNTLATADEDGAYLWDASKSPPERRQIFESASTINVLAFSDDGSLLATGFHTDRFEPTVAHIWETHSGQQVKGPMQHDDGVLDLAFSHDGTKLIAACENRLSLIWDVTQDTAPIALRQSGQVQLAGFGGDDRFVFTVAENRIRVWEADSGQPVTPLMQLPYSIIGGLFVGNELRLATVGKQFWRIPLIPNNEDLGSLQEMANWHTWQIDGSDDIQERWNQMRETVLPQFRPSATEAAAWHEMQVRRCFDANNRWGVKFHMERLASLLPEGTALENRIEWLKGYLERTRFYEGN